jgi:hypothetical protein
MDNFAVVNEKVDKMSERFDIFSETFDKMSKHYDEVSKKWDEFITFKKRLDEQNHHVIVYEKRVISFVPTELSKEAIPFDDVISNIETFCTIGVDDIQFAQKNNYINGFAKLLHEMFFSVFTPSKCPLKITNKKTKRFLLKTKDSWSEDQVANIKNFDKLVNTIILLFLKSLNQIQEDGHLKINEAVKIFNGILKLQKENNICKKIRYKFIALS